MKNMRHKWNGNNSFNRIRNNSDGRSSMAVACVKCGCVKEYIDGIPTYFIDDVLHDGKAPPCDERLLNTEQPQPQ